MATIKPEDTPALLLQRVARIRPHTSLISDFAYLLLQGTGFSDYLTPIFTGISVPHLSPEQIKAFVVAVPGLSEQNEIVKFVADETAKINLASSVAYREMELLREHETRLIADVVTGKLDVRAIAASLPEAIEPAIDDEPDDVDLKEGEDAPEDEEAAA